MLGFDDWIGWLSCSEYGADVVITAEDRPHWAHFAEEGHYSNHQPGTPSRLHPAPYPSFNSTFW